jgi:hypothetical protein
MPTKKINLSLTKVNGEMYLTCPLGCKIQSSIGLQLANNDFDVKGISYAQALTDSNKFLAYDEVNGAFLGNPSTDREFIVPFLNMSHLNSFICLHKDSLPADLEYHLTNDYKALNQDYKWEIEIDSTIPE